MPNFDLNSSSDQLINEISETAFSGLEHDLEELTLQLNDFNIFEAFTNIRSELFHSNLLAYLFNPTNSHGLKEALVREFLEVVLEAFPGALPLESGGLERIQNPDRGFQSFVVRREWQNIDILLEAKALKLLVVIENKIDSQEHSNQLQRYREIVEANYPGWIRLYLFLTPHGTQGSDRSYLNIDYGLVLKALEKVISNNSLNRQGEEPGLSSSLPSPSPSPGPAPDVLLLLTHYARLLRRHIVKDRDIIRISRELYQRHQKALDLIFQYRPDNQLFLRKYLEQLVKENPDFIFDSASKEFVRFFPKKWDLDQPILRSGNAFPSRRILYFEFQIGAASLDLYLTFGPGDETVRAKLAAAATRHPEIFRLESLFNGEWQHLYSSNFLESPEITLSEEAVLQETINHLWSVFLDGDFPKIEAALRGEEWF